jgi:hypothetical protein
MTDELHVRDFTITDADGNVRHGKYGVITGDGVARLIDAATLLYVSLDAVDRASVAVEITRLLPDPDPLPLPEPEHAEYGDYDEYPSGE